MNNGKQSVNSVNRGKPPLAQAETETETETDKNDASASSVDSASESPVATERKFVESWNLAEGVVKNRGETLTAGRRAKFRARLRNKTWLADAHDAIAKFPLPLFAERAEGWKPDMDWILKPDTVYRIIEGKYDWTKESGGHPVDSEAAAAERKRKEQDNEDKKRTRARQEQAKRNRERWAAEAAEKAKLSQKGGE